MSQEPKKMGRPPRLPDKDGNLLCNQCKFVKPGHDFYRKSNGYLDSYCIDCRKKLVQVHRSPRTDKQTREKVWSEWYRRERLRLEAAGHEDPPGYNAETKVFDTPELTPELAREMLELDRRIGPPPPGFGGE